MSAPSPADVIGFLAGPGAAALGEFVARQRWFAAKARGVRALGLEDWAPLRSVPPLVILLVNVDGDRYCVPLSVASSPPADARPRVARLGAETIYDAHWDPDFGRLLLAAIASGAILAGVTGRFCCRPVEPWDAPSAAEIAAMPVRPLAGEQSNTSLVFDRALILKSIRRPQAGINPDFEIAHFLTTRTGFPHAARLYGGIDYADRAGGTATVAVLQRFVENAGDGWAYTLAGLHRLCESIERDGEPVAPLRGSAERHVVGLAGDVIAPVRTLGVVTGQLHAALAADPSLPSFSPEPITGDDAERWRRGIALDFELLRSDLEAARSRLPAAAEPAPSLLEHAGSRIAQVLGNLRLLVDGQTRKIRCHGDYHLGQVLKTADAFLVIDFEGEPGRPLEERRRKHSPLRDVAGMLRSFNYAVHTVARERAAAGRAPLLGWLEWWETVARRAFLDGYVAAAAKSPVRLVPPAARHFAQACAVFELEKAGYELRYELNNRPDWIPIPLAGISRILGEDDDGIGGPARGQP
jgi:maltose alpha-D-glucosyltransferase/alpha-amylase